MALPRNELIEFPTGRWGFVGSVDCELGYRRPDGLALTDDDMDKVCRYGPDLAGVKSLSFPTRESAIAARDALEYDDVAP